MKKRLLNIFSFLLTLFIPFNPKSSFQDNKYISRITKRFILINSLRKCYINHFLFNHSIKLNKYLGKIDAFSFQKKWMELFPNLTEEQKMIMIYYIYSSRCLNNDICRMILEFAELTDNTNYMYWIVQNISKIVFLSQSGNYKNFYIERKNLIRKVLVECKLNVPKRKERKNEQNILCVVAYLLSSSSLNSSQRVISMFSNNLSKFFDQVVVLDMNCFSTGNDDDSYIGSYIRYDDSVETRKTAESSFKKKNISVVYSVGNDYKSRMQFCLDYIYNLNPRVILDLSDEYSLISYYYAKDFKTYYFSLRGLASSLYFDYFVNTKWLCERIDKEQRGYTSEKIVDWIFPEYLPQLVDKYTRETIGIKDNSFIILSIGNNTIFSRDFCDAVTGLLRKHDDTIWLLVGEPAPVYLQRENTDLFLNKRIINYGFEKELYSLCKQCNVLLRYNTTGGSGATAIAAKAGLPIAMTTFLCDPMRWLGPDYSINSNYQNVIDYVERLYLDSDYYHSMQEKTVELINNAIDSEEKWISLVRHMKGTIDE